MNSVSDSTMSCMSASTIWTLYSALTFSDSAGLAKAFGSQMMFRQDGARVGEEDDLIHIGGTPVTNLYDQFTESPTGVKAPVIMY